MPNQNHLLKISGKNLPFIDLIHTKDNLNVNRITEHDHLIDENWHEWKERMRRVFCNCDITGYITGDIKHPNAHWHMELGQK